MVLVTPPCSTWSRVRGANCRGPPTIRSKEHPWGFPWLSKRRQKDADLGNTLIRFMIQVLEVLDMHPYAASGHLVLIFAEHPEDLGVIYREEDGIRMFPASIWQLQELRRLAQSLSLKLATVAFNQCCWQAPYKKPTRLLTHLSALKHWEPNEWPTFHADGSYQGPLTDACSCTPSVTLARQPHDDNFRTTATSIHPAAMDRAIAAASIHEFLHAPTSSKEGDTQLEHEPGDNDVEEQGKKRKQPAVARTPPEDEGSEEGPEESWPRPAHASQVQGRDALFARWGWQNGLCLPGRWPVHLRNDPTSEVAKDLMRWFLRAFDDWLKLEGGEKPERRRLDRKTEINFRRLMAVAEVLEDVRAKERSKKIFPQNLWQKERD